MTKAVKYWESHLWGLANYKSCYSGHSGIILYNESECAQNTMAEPPSSAISTAGKRVKTKCVAICEISYGYSR